jgi:DNA modification methylase
MKNKFNNLTSKEWLPFQKSWFIDKSIIETYKSNLRFFIKFDDEGPPGVLFWGSKKNRGIINRLAGELEINIYSAGNFTNAGNLQFILLDARDIMEAEQTLNNYDHVRSEIIKLCNAAFGKLKDKRFISVLIPNLYQNRSFFPAAWDLAKHLSAGLSLKDEKIGCYNDRTAGGNDLAAGNIFYSLYFRKDENCTGVIKEIQPVYFKKPVPVKTPCYSAKPPFSWHIIKPKPRSRTEILHPAKYPEELVDIFLEAFTKEGDNVFDPMSGSGSTQYAAVNKNRNGYGTELSPFFAKIAISRLDELSLLKAGEKAGYKLLIKDARQIRKTDFPPIDYIITSPPYWDMLNMKGAEYQARRREKGLQLNYSEDGNDLGNLTEYEEFINDLSGIYFKLHEILKPGGIMTIIVKNIKKKGRNYPLAYDLARVLQEKYILLPEVFWCQDDINIAPYGYGNTFVSNTFHQYCLNFQKPA